MRAGKNRGLEQMRSGDTAGVREWRRSGLPEVEPEPAVEP
jgi:hypothetical protein